jgi:DNA-binding transcriptional ArsR family regulator
MTLTIESLHKILKEETRQKIVVLLHSKGGLTYSDLLQALKGIERGRLNYHLKLLAPIVTKNDQQYVLNKQGILAWKRLQELSYADKLRLANYVKYSRAGVLSGLVIIFFLSYNQYVNCLWLLAYVTAFSISIIAAVVMIKLQSNKLLSCHSMDCIDTSLHQTLSDATRRKIVRLLREKGNLSYSELMKETKIDSSGKMNYHLKVLDDLLSTNGDGQYALTEKGEFAYTSLNTFQNKRSLPKLNTPWRQWIGPTFLSTLYLIGIFFLYSRGVLDLEIALLNLTSVLVISSALFYFSKVNDNLKLDNVKNMIT